MLLDQFKFGRHLVYTVIAGDYDSLKRPLWCPPNVDYLAFVSEPVESESRGWQLSPLPNDIYNPKLLNRRMKILGFGFDEEYDSVIYVDGSIQIIGSLDSAIAQFLQSERALGLFRHEDRNRPRDELIACLELGLLSENEHRFEESRIRQFEDDGIDLGLFDAGVIMKNPRREALSKISSRWFELFSENPVRDQLSLPIVVWEQQQHVFLFEHWRKSYAPTFLRYPHNSSGRVIKFLFWIGSAFPPIFHSVAIFCRKQRQRLVEVIVVR